MFNTKKPLISIIAMLLGIALLSPIALAQEDAAPNIAQIGAEEQAPTGAEQAVMLDENITSEDLGVKDQKVLPGNPFYFFKNIGRGLKSAFTFNAVKKAELKLRFANEKIIEAQKLAEDKPNALPKAIENYKKESAKLSKTIAKIKANTEDEKVNSFVTKFIDNNIKQQKLLGKFEKQTTPENYEKMEAAKEQAAANFSEISAKFANPELLKEKITAILENQKGSDFKHFKNLEVLERVRDAVPEEAKQAIEQAMENASKRLKEKLEQMPEEQRKQFAEYAEKIGGNQLKQLKAMDRMAREDLSPEIREKLEQAKEKVLEGAEQRLEKYKGEENAGEEFLKNLTERGEFEDLRIIKELENNLPPEALEKIIEAKEKAKIKIIEKMERLKEMPEQRQEFLEKIQSKFHDVRQLEALKEIEGASPADNQEFIKELKEKTTRKLQEQISNARRLAPAKKARILDQIAGNSPEHLEILGELSPTTGARQELIDYTSEKIYERAEKIIDSPERIENLREKIEKAEPIKRILQANQPTLFKKLEAKQQELEERKRKEIEFKKAQELDASQIKKPETELDIKPEDLRPAQEVKPEIKFKPIQLQDLQIEAETGAGNDLERVKAGEQACRQVITPAMGPDGACVIFRNDCEVPAGWKVVAECPDQTKPANTSKPTTEPKPVSNGASEPPVIEPQRTSKPEPFNNNTTEPDSGSTTNEPAPETLPVIEEGAKIIPGEARVCIQVITYAQSPTGECKKFSTPCNVPSTWRQVSKCY